MLIQYLSFPNAFPTVSQTTLVLMFIYCKYNYTIAKLNNEQQDAFWDVPLYNLKKLTHISQVLTATIIMVMSKLCAKYEVRYIGRSKQGHSLAG
jgi:hypothetical protein